MNKEEKEILRKSIKRKTGLYSPAEMINGIANHNRSLVENLVTKGYLEEVPTQINTGATYNFYRVSHKGLILFEPWYKRFSFYFKGDLRTIIISVITTILTTLATILIGNILN